MRVAFILDQYDKKWMGGFNYFQTLIRNLNNYSTEIEVVIITGIDNNLFGLESCARKVVRDSYFSRNSFRWFVRKALHKILSKDIILNNILRRLGIDLLSHYKIFNCSVPTLIWIADFQHNYLPEFFSEEEISQRNSSIKLLVESGCSILVSSQNAADDLVKFYGYPKKPYILRFVSTPPPEWQPGSKKDLQSKYKLPEHWFHLPNQFWAHKNHICVLEALDFLNKVGKEFTVIATGDFSDYRNSKHFDVIRCLIQDKELESNFRMTGVIPLYDVYSLMYYAVAVINPSFFEGWSTTVEEGKSLGKLMILSDIPIHREQSPNRVNYFDPRKPSELADCLQRAYSEFDHIYENEKLARELLARGERTKEFIRDYELLATEASCRD